MLNPARVAEEKLTNSRQARHILGLSGGKDSTALAIHMRDRVPQMEYFFCDTGEELPETYEYLDKLEAYLGKPIARLGSERGFEHYLTLYNSYLPSSRMRWCTSMLKLRPLEEFVGDEPTTSYIGIRADEDRIGYLSHKPNLTAVYPFKEDGLVKADILKILEESGLGLPSYYKWRSRSGCYFCFFQQKIEWVGLKENHPELFEKAKAYEKTVPENGIRFTWSEKESLEELEKPERIAQIKAVHEKRKLEASQGPNKSSLLADMNLDDDDEDDLPCMLCQK
jgi:hypothetical protein